jgi:hypothetical protein
MRFFYITVFCLSMNLQAAAQNDQPTPVNSKITDVTIFSSGVQVNRSASARVASGSNKLIFKELSPFIQANTVRVTLEGNATVLSVQYGLSVPVDKKRETDIAKNEQFIAQKNDQITRFRNELKVVNQEEGMLQKNQVQVIGLTNYSLKPAELEDLMAMQNRRLAAVINHQYDLGKSIATVESQRDSLKKVIEDLKVITATPSGELIVELSAAQSVQVKMTVTYYIPQAAWTPIYDVRVKDISKPVNLVQRASIYQQTGEEWADVKMRLSTGDPNMNNIAPTIQPWKLLFYSPYARAERRQSSASRFTVSGRTSASEIRGKIMDGETGEPLIGASIIAIGTNMGAQTDIDGSFILKIPPEATAIRFTYTGFSELIIPIASARGSMVDVMLGSNYAALSEVVVTGYGSKRDKLKKREEESIAKDELDEGELPAKVVALPTTILYEIDVPVTLAPNGKPLVLDIKNYELPATYQHYTVPKLDPQVYLTAMITGWDSLGLLSGPTNLFFEGTYLGKSYLEFVTVSDTLTLSLGRDQNVVATRTKIREFSKRRFLSDQKEDARSFELVFKNKKNVPISLLVADQIPISTKKSIEVKPADLSGATLDEETGIMEWKMEIKPGGTEKRKMGYTVRYPKQKIVVLE